MEATAAVSTRENILFGAFPTDERDAILGTVNVDLVVIQHIASGPSEPNVTWNNVMRIQSTAFRDADLIGELSAVWLTLLPVRVRLQLVRWQPLFEGRDLPEQFNDFLRQPSDIPLQASCLSSSQAGRLGCLGSRRGHRLT
jgi:hypothetical protein